MYVLEKKPFQATLSKSCQLSADIYRRAFLLTFQFVRNNAGNFEEAQDVFQDACYVYLEKQDDLHFDNDKALVTYLFMIGRNLWLKQLNSKRTKVLPSYYEIISECTSHLYELREAEVQRDDLLNNAVDQLDEESRRIFNYLVNNWSYNEIAQELNYQNPAYLRLKKYRIIRRLSQMVSKK